jgi:hypothetical protein
MLTTATGKPLVSGFHCRQLQKDAYKSPQSLYGPDGCYHKGGSSDLHPILSLGLAASPGATAPHRNCTEVESSETQRGGEHSQLFP